MAAGWRKEYGDKCVSHTSGWRLESISKSGVGKVGGRTRARLAVVNEALVYWRSRTVFLRAIFVPQQVVQSSRQTDEETQSGVAGNSGRTAMANQRGVGANTPNGGAQLLGAIFCTKLGLHNQSGARLCCTWVRFAPGFPATHILCRVSVFPLNIIDRTVTSSRP